MLIASYSSFRQNMKHYLDTVFNSKAPLFVTRANAEDMVVISKAEYDSMEETMHLLSSPKNAQRLAEGIKEFEEGKGGIKKLIE